ncbi:unnamed protein product [Closterium sp. NIES-54]
MSDAKDSVSLFDLVSGAATAPPATTDSATRSLWLTLNAAARLAIRNHLLVVECSHFGQHRTAHALYDAVVTRYSSPATAAPLWHHRLGHPSLPRLRGMHSRLLVSGLPRSLPPLPPSPAPPCHASRGGSAPLLTPPHFPRRVLPCRLSTWTGGEFSSDLLRDFCGGEGITQSFTLSDSPQQNGIAECRIGLVMEVARTSMIHAVAPHFLWSFAVRYAVHQLNLWPHVSLPKTSPTLRWTGKVGDASVFRVWGSRAFVRDMSADKLSARAIPCVDPLPSYAPVEVAVGSGVARGAASGGAESEGVGSGGAGPRGAEPGGAEPAGVEPGGAKPEGAESGGAEPRGAASSGGAGGAGATRGGGNRVPAGAYGTRGTAAGGPGGARTKGTGDAGTSGVGEAGAGDPTEPGAAGAGCAGAGGAGVGGTGAGGAGAAGAGALYPGAGGAGGTVWPRPYFVPLLQQTQSLFLSASPLPAPSPYTEQSGVVSLRLVLSRLFALLVAFLVRVLLLSWHAYYGTPSFLCSTACSSACSFKSAAASALDAELLDFAAACRLHYATALVAESESASPPSVGGECALGTDVLEDRQEEFECLAAAVHCFASILLALKGEPDAPDIPTPRSYTEAITRPYSSQWQVVMDAEMASWKSTGTYVDGVPPSRANIVDGMWIFRVKRQPGSLPAFKAHYVARGFSHRQGVDYFQTFSPTPKMSTLRVLLRVAAQREYELHSLEFSTAFLQGSLHEEIWLRRPPGFTRLFPAALGFTPSNADPSLFLRTDTSLSPLYVIVYVDDLVFATGDTEALTLVKFELQKRHTCTDLGELRSYLGLQITRDRARRTITLTHHSLSAPPSDESVEPSGLYPELVGCLMYLMTCTRPDLAYPPSLLARYVAPGRHRKVHWDAAKRVLRYLCSTSGMGLVLGGRGPIVLTGHADAFWVDDSATQQSSQGYTFSLGFGSVSWRSTRSSLVLSSSCEAEIYAGAMAAQELRWLTYLLSDLGEQPRLPPVLYVDNKAMIALCHEHRMEHRTKHIALRYFLACVL